jgi:hypothetical protein
MSRRVFTPKGKKEQLQQQVLMMIRIIRRKLDHDVLKKAQEIAIEINRNSVQTTNARSVSDFDQSSQANTKESHSVPFNKEGARAAVSGFLMLNKDRPDLASKIFKMLNEN